MFFNSLDFAVFLPVVFLIYWLIPSKNKKSQNAFIVAASYLFYGWWDWRFLSLIFLSTLVDYSVGCRLDYENRPTHRKRLLGLSLIVNLGLLGFFKYFNFFVENFCQAFSFLGTDIQGHSLNIILPVGISFYTFQTLSYTFDIYRRELKPTKDFIAFSAFVSFFPQLVAGPIERARNLLPQFEQQRTFSYASAMEGQRQILWGLFKKILIADNCAIYANQIFAHPTEHTGSVLWLGSLFFAFQIYGDFSGYSDIAIGTARLFGIRLSQNFNFPYFSRDIAEFWRRWHISLSTWFRDYLYIPLGGSRCNSACRIRNVFIIFMVCGFWHGANWTFIFWGALNALFFIPLLLMGKNRKHMDTAAKNKFFPSFRELRQIGLTFFLTLIAWVVFRSETMSHAVVYISGMLSLTLFTFPYTLLRPDVMITLAFILGFCIVEWIGREQQFAIQKPLLPKVKYYRWWEAYILLFMILLFGNFDKNPFIYFQF